MKTTITPVLWSRPDKNGLYPIKIRITKNRKSTYHPIGESIEIVMWSLQFNRVLPKYPNSGLINRKIDDYIKQIERSELMGVDITTNGRVSLNEFFEMLITKKHERSKFYSTKRYQSVYNHLKSFSSNKVIHFSEVDKNFILRFIDFLERSIKPQKKGRKPSPNTINNYVKVLRSVINTSIETETYLGENPFTIKKLIPKKSKSTKPALSKDELWLLDYTIHHHLQSPSMKMALDIFLFCFWSNGIRISDALTLRYSDIGRKKISVETMKTRRGLIIPLTPHNSEKIIEYFPNNKSFLFSWKLRKYPVDFESISKSVQRSKEDRKEVLKSVHPYLLTSQKNNQKKVEQTYVKYIIKRQSFEEFYKFLPLLRNQPVRHYSSGKEPLVHQPKYSVFTRPLYLERVKEPERDLYGMEEIMSCREDFRMESLVFSYEVLNSIKDKSTFVFPYLRGLENSSDLEIQKKVESCTVMINNNLKKISEINDIQEFTTHFARRSFATHAIGSGEDIYRLKDLLGHSKVSQTEEYISSIELPDDDINENLSNYLK